MKSRPCEKRVKIFAPFPPCGNKWGQVFRPVLRFLRVWKEDEYEITLREMTQDNLYQYYDHLMGSLAVLQDYADFNVDFMRVMQNSIMRSHEVAKISPHIFSLATGINDPEWFSSLSPSQIHLLEEAIDEANPSIVEAKKKLTELAKKVEEEMERQSVGRESSTSSVNATV
jgi:hypothetical protein